MSILEESASNKILEDLKETFRRSIFGVELESCINIGENIAIPPYKHGQGSLKAFQLAENMARFLNSIIKNNTTAALVKDKGDIDHHFFFGLDVGYHSTDVKKKWTFQNDVTIECQGKVVVTRYEIVTPILYMGKGLLNTYRSRNPNLSKNKIYEYLEEKFSQTDTFFEGLMILMYYHEVLFNGHESNDKNRNRHNSINLENNVLNSLHVHISNEKMKNEPKGFVALAHFLRTWYFFENIIYSFLEASRENTVHAVKTNTLAPADQIDALPRIFKTLIEADQMNKNIINAKTIKEYFLNDRRRVSINLQHIKIEHTDPNIPIHIEIRSHHGTTNISEIYNWIVLINLILSTCINEIDTVFQYVKGQDRDLKQASVLLGSFTESYIENYNQSYIDQGKEYKFVSVKMFNLLFDRFVKCETLRKYYQNKTRFALFKNNKEIKKIEPSLVMHPSFLFNDVGKLGKRPNIFDEFASKFYSENFQSKNKPGLFELVVGSKKSDEAKGKEEEIISYKKYIKYKSKYLKLRNGLPSIRDGYGKLWSRVRIKN